MISDKERRDKHAQVQAHYEARRNGATLPVYSKSSDASDISKDDTPTERSANDRSFTFNTELQESPPVIPPNWHHTHQRRSKRAQKTTPPSEADRNFATQIWTDHDRADLVAKIEEQAAIFVSFHLSCETVRANWDAMWRTSVFKALDHVKPQAVEKTRSNLTPEEIEARKAFKKPNSRKTANSQTPDNAPFSASIQCVIPTQRSTAKANSARQWINEDRTHLQNPKNPN